MVGAGPAGAVLALLLARRGLDVTLLEAHRDFDREFRGDTIHPSTMEILDEIGLADRLLELPHQKVATLAVQTANGTFTLADFRRLRTRFPYVTLMPQTRFLEFLTGEAQRYPSFELVMGANVKELIRRENVVCGVRFPEGEGWREVHASLTVGADGRFSKLRRLTGLEALKTSPPMDVLWFRLSRATGDPRGAMGRLVAGGILVLLDRGEHWQVGFVIPKGSYHALREAGIEALRSRLAQAAPELAERVRELERWSNISLLQVEADRLRRWYVPGLLLIGDAAHIMSPVGGLGINYAVQDAVVAANLLGPALERGRVETADLAGVQRKRERPTRLVQALQRLMQERVVAEALASSRPLRVPAPVRWVLRIPGLRALPAWLMAFGTGRVHVEGQAKSRLRDPVPSPHSGVTS